nr:MAG TPA: hypothetical protein [Caudoviricetes sp.]
MSSARVVRCWVKSRRVLKYCSVLREDPILYGSSFIFQMKMQFCYIKIEQYRKLLSITHISN